MKASWVLVLLLVGGSGDAFARTISYAVAIGNNAPPRESAGNLAVLRYADDDAVRYYQLFARFAQQTRLLTVMDADTQRRYPGLASAARSPTLANLLIVVAEYSRRMEADRARGDEPVFYLAFSGHGTRSETGDAFLVLLDARLTQDVLYEQILAKLPATYHHLIVDACNAAAVVGVRGGFFDHELETKSARVSPSELISLAERTQNRYPTVGALVATTEGQEAHEWSRIESGVFTHEVISGLLGAADVNRDSRIEYSELQAFISAANRGIKDPRASPQVIARPPKINQSVALVSLDRLHDAVILAGQTGQLGHFYVELDNGQRYLDANIAAESDAALVLPAGTSAFVRTKTLEAEIPRQARGTVKIHKLAFKQRQVVARGSIDAAYRAALFSLPYGPTYYRGFVDSNGALGVSFQESASAGETVTDSSTGHRGWAIGLLSVAGVSAVTAITTGILTLQAKSDFESTMVQRDALNANHRYTTYSAIALTSGVVAAAAGSVSWWLWPKTTPTVTAVSSPDGHSVAYGLGIRREW